MDSGFGGLKKRLTMSNYNMPRLAGPVIGPPRKRGTQQGAPTFDHSMKQFSGQSQQGPLQQLRLNGLKR